MDIREQAVKYALSELAIDGIRPDIDLDAPLPLVEQEMVECVSIYRGSEVAAEVKRQFVIASIS